eukprot:5917131-Heterocapsa_arctica.AAC.1
MQSHALATRYDAHHGLEIVRVARCLGRTSTSTGRLARGGADGPVPCCQVTATCGRLRGRRR